VENLLESLCDPKKEPMSTRGEAMVAYLGRFKQEGRLIAKFAREYKLGYNVFSTKAYERDFTWDGVPVEAAAYWSKDCELVARAAEAYFLDKGASGALVHPARPLPSEDYWRHPHGEERVEIVGELERWMKAALVPAIELSESRALSGAGARRARASGAVSFGRGA
jgi:hypothetical protein